MEKIKCPHCGEMITPEVYHFRDDKFPRDINWKCSCPRCEATSRALTQFGAIEAFRHGNVFGWQKDYPVKEQPQPDMVNHPNHYINENGVECQTVIDYVLSNIDVTKTAAYWLGCAIKYLFRYKRKGKPIQDLSKARVCFDRAIEYLKKDVENTQ